MSAPHRAKREGAVVGVLAGKGSESKVSVCPPCILPGRGVSRRYPMVAAPVQDVTQ